MRQVKFVWQMPGITQMLLLTLPIELHAERNERHSGGHRHTDGHVSLSIDAEHAGIARATLRNGHADEHAPVANLHELGVCKGHMFENFPQERPQETYFHGTNPRDLFHEHDKCPFSHTNTMCANVLPASVFPTEEDCVMKTPFVRDIKVKHQFQICSQLGQDGIIFEVLRHIKVSPSKYYVEVGARKPDQLNSAHLRINCGWHGLLLDKQSSHSDAHARELITDAFITADNVNDVFEKNEVPNIFDVLTLDFDSNEYWVWKAIDESRFLPRVVALEFTDQPRFQLKDAQVIQKNNTKQWKTSMATPKALWLLARRKGYCLVSVALWHIVFAYCSLLHPEDRGMTLEELPFDPYTAYPRIANHDQEVREQLQGVKWIDVEKDLAEKAFLQQPPIIYRVL